MLNSFYNSSKDDERWQKPRKEIKYANGFIKNPQRGQDKFKEKDCILFYTEKQLKEFMK